MGLRGGLTLFHIRGIRIAVDWSWFIVLFLAIFFLSQFYRDLLGQTTEDIEPYLLALISALLFFASILLHELGHAFVAIRNGIGINHITLWMFGGVASLQRDTTSAGVEFRVAIAGPAVTLAIAAVCSAVGVATTGEEFWKALVFNDSADTSGAVAVVTWLANINLLILFFNLIPAFPLDGGRVTRAIAWKLTGSRNQATKFAANLGQVFSWGFVAGGIALFFIVGAFVGVWLALIGWILGQSARATIAQTNVASQIEGVTVADVMDTEPVAIREDTSVESALDEYFLRYQWPWFPVVDTAERFIGLIKRGAADAVPEVRRASARVAEVFESDSGEPLTVRDDAHLEDLLSNEPLRDQLRRLGALAAVDSQGRLSGVLRLDDLGRALRDAPDAEPSPER
jgi:Zn-dependent protease